MVKAAALLGKGKDSVWWTLRLPWESARILLVNSYAPLGTTQGFCVVDATPPLGKRKILCDESYAFPQESYMPLKKPQGFCVLKTAPPFRKRQGFCDCCGRELGSRRHHEGGLRVRGLNARALRQ